MCPAGMQWGPTMQWGKPIAGKCSWDDAPIALTGGALPRPPPLPGPQAIVNCMAVNQDGVMASGACLYCTAADADAYGLLLLLLLLVMMMMPEAIRQHAPTGAALGPVAGTFDWT